MSVVAILGVGQDRNTRQRMFNVGVTEDFKTATCRTMTEQALAMEIVRGKHRLVNAKVVDGKRIEDSLGSFRRFEVKNNFKPVVVVAVCTNEAGRTLGYVIISQSGIISRVKKEDLYESCKLAKNNDVAFLQNAVYREANGVQQIAGYEDNCFPVIRLQSSVNRRPANASVNKSSEPARRVTQQAQTASASKTEHKPVRPASAEVHTPLTMSPAQNKELEAAKKAGVNPMLIDSPKLSPEKQRVIWAAKKNGIAAEYFTNPKFNKDQMVFFADRLENDDRFKECMSFVDPKYSVEQMKQLYLGVCSGVDVNEYLDESLTPEEMYIKRIELENELYDKTALICSVPDEVCIRNFMRRRGLLSDNEAEATANAVSGAKA